MKLTRKKIRIIFILIIVILLIVNRGFRGLIVRFWKQIRTQKEIEEIKKNSAKLRQEIYLLENDSSHIEYCIRKDLGYIKPGEIEYRIGVRSQHSTK